MSLKTYQNQEPVNANFGELIIDRMQGTEVPYGLSFLNAVEFVKTPVAEKSLNDINKLLEIDTKGDESTLEPFRDEKISKPFDSKMSGITNQG